MERKSIKQTLMERDEISAEEAKGIIADAKEALQEYVREGDLNGAYNVCEEYLGLEPDYLDDLIAEGLI